MTTAAVKAFFFGSDGDIFTYETIEFVGTAQRYVRNAKDGLTADLTYTYMPYTVQPSQVENTLDYRLAFNIGVVDAFAAVEFLREWSSSNDALQINYRTYRSDNLASPLFGPILLNIQTATMGESGFTVVAGARAMNKNTTGRAYTLDRFPGLDGYLQ